MNSPHKAIILAAGYGTRMNPLGRHIPKTLMPIWGRATIVHTIDILLRWGVQEILINLHHGANSIFQYLRTLHYTKVSFSYEPKILGSGGALKRASWFLGEMPFWLVNGDIALDLDPSLLLRDFSTPNTISSLWMINRGGPRTVEMKNNIITSFRSTQAICPDTYTFCGLQLVSPDILEDIQDETPVSIIDVYERAISRGKRVSGICIPDVYWADLGTPESYLAAHKQIMHAKEQKQRGGTYISEGAIRRMCAIKKEGTHIDGFASIPATVSVKAGTRLRNVVALENSEFHRGCKVTNAIVASPVPSGASITRLCLSADKIHDKTLRFLLGHLGWPVKYTIYQPFAPRGSSRRFYRIVYKKHSAIVMQYDDNKPENIRYVSNSKFLENQGIHVPKIIHDFSSKKILVIEDMGEESLGQQLKNCTPFQRERLYRRVLREVTLLHGPATHYAKRRKIPLEQPFGSSIYTEERALFRSYYLEQHLNLSQSNTCQAMKELQIIEGELCKLPQVLIHRDLQSSNIFFRKTVPVFIDFQGMRFGAAEYDLASLLADPYVCLPFDVQKKLLCYYASLTNRKFALLLEYYQVATIQRLCQAIGAYAHLGSSPQTMRFQRYIIPALKILRHTLKGFSKANALEVLVNNAYQQELCINT